MQNGTQVQSFTYDDEDRLVSMAIPGGVTDTFVYNGLGLRIGKSDSTGTYSYLCDGASPGSPVLSDGHAVYTPGLSENKGGASRYYSFDRRGNLWTVDGSSKSQVYYEDETGFGSLFALSGSGTAYGFDGADGCQRESDSSLVLMGHRYYDSRTGRFISQDPAGSGDNWYAYAGNDPVDNTDPTGLVIAGGGMGMFQDPTQAGSTYDPNNDANAQYYDGVPGEYNDYNSKTGAYMGSEWRGATAFDQMNGSSMGPGMGMFAQGGGKLTPSEADRANYLSKKIDNIARDLQKRKGELREDPSKLAERVKGDKAKPSLSRWGHRKIMNELKNTMDRTMNELKSILQKAGVATEGLDDITFDIPIIMIYNPHNVYGGWKPNEGPT